MNSQDFNEYAKLSKEYSNMKPVVEKSSEFIKLQNELEDTEELLSGDDAEIRKEAEEEKEKLKNYK